MGLTLLRWLWRRLVCFHVGHEYSQYNGVKWLRRWHYHEVQCARCGDILWCEMTRVSRITK